MLALAIAAQQLHPVARRHPKIVELFRRIDRKKLRSGTPLDLQRQIANDVAREDRCRPLVRKALDHARTYRNTVRSVNGIVPRGGTLGWPGDEDSNLDRRSQSPITA